jgi:5-methylthioribose kinase
MQLDFDLSDLLQPDETLVSINKAGEGNMNLVLRAKTDRRSFIIKLAKPYVVKYPSIPAPLERIDTEYTYYQSMQGDDFLIKKSPKIQDYKPERHLLIMEDLGELQDFTTLYHQPNIEDSTLIELLQYLSRLHQLTINEFPSNLPMRKLNHEHIFILPFDQNNGLNLDEVQHGLQDLADSIHQNLALKKEALRLGEIYLSKGSSLVHGDFYPGSWMMSKEGLKVIDPEFSFVGNAEFDLGIMAAHLKMSAVQKDFYALIASHYSHSFQVPAIKQWEGIEIIRRLIGVAQLPLEKSLSEKEELLKYATQLVLNP